MYCKECGKQIDNDSKYCSYCGTLQSINIIGSKGSTNSDVNETKSSIYNNTSSHSQQGKVSKSSNKYDSKYEKPYGLSILGFSLWLITIVISFFTELSNEQYAALSGIGIILRIGLTVAIVNTARDQNRDRVLWGVFGFFFTSLALIIIGLSPKLYRQEEQVTFTNNKKNIGDDSIPSWNIISVEKARTLINGRFTKYTILFSNGLEGELFYFHNQKKYSHPDREVEYYYDSKEECIRSLYKYLRKKE